MPVGVAGWSEHVVHLPRPEDFGAQAEARAALLEDVRYLLLVGSLERPRRIVEMAGRELGLAAVGSYFNLADDRGVADREFNIEVLDLGVEPRARVAIISHGIGMAGAEITIAETFALLNLVRAEQGALGLHALCGVGRSGTRGTLGAEAMGTIGLSTASYSEAFETAMPDPELVQRCIAAAAEMGAPLAMGPGISTGRFWAGQGRSLPTQRPLPGPLLMRQEAARQALLWSWVERGVRFVEMEDHTVHAVCQHMGIPSVSAGAIIARRYDPTAGRFVLAYDAAAKQRSELLPAAMLLRAFQSHWSELQARGGVAALMATS